MTARTMRFLPRFRYRLATVFALITLICVPLSRRAQREHEYRLRLAAVAVLVDGDGKSVGVENGGRGDESRTSIYFGQREYVRGSGQRLRILQPDEVVVDASCDSSDSDISAVMDLPTLQRLSLRDVPTGRFEEPPSEAPPGTLAGISENKELALAYAKLWKSPVRPPTGAIDAAVRKIAKLPLLEELDLYYTSVSDEGLRSLACAPRLRVLNLRLTKITDAGLKNLSSLSKLEELNLESTAVTDDGVRYLVALRSLRILSLRATKVMGSGFDALGPPHPLETLDLSDSNVSDEGIRHLATVTSIRELNLDRTKISGAVLEHLSTMRELRTLSLWADDIGDESLPHLARLPNLTRLGLVGTRVSGLGLSALEASMSLEELDLRKCPAIGDAGLVRLSRIHTLRKVELGQAQPLTAAGVDELKRLRPDIDVSWVDDGKLESVFGDN